MLCSVLILIENGIYQEVREMRLCRFEVRNFKNLGQVEFCWDDMIVLIGENNVGKSTLLQALDVFLEGRSVKEKAYFHQGRAGYEHRIELVGTFDQLTEAEQRNPAVQGRMYGEQWILRKSFWYDAAEQKWQEEYAVYCTEEAIVEWPAERVRSWKEFAGRFEPLIADVVAERGNGRYSIEAEARLKELVRERHPEWVGRKEAQYVPSASSGAGSWKAKADQVLPQLISVPAVQEASDVAQAKERTPYGKILSLIVEKQLIDDPEVQALQEGLNRLQAKIGLDDDEGNPVKAEAIREAENKISHFLGQVIPSKAHIVADSMRVTDLIMPNTMLKLDDGYPTTVGNKGHGLQRALIMSLLQVLAEYEAMTTAEEAEERRSVIFAVEEPELYMHPQMERKMRDALYGLAATPNYQVICTTHSPVFLDMSEKHTSIVRLERREDGVRAFQVLDDLFTGEGAEERKKHLRMITEFDPAVNELFFAKRVVLVEGPTELAVFHKAADYMGIFEDAPHVKRDTTFVNCHGKWTIPLFVEVLNHFEVRYAVFHDEDRGKQTAEAANEVIGQAVRTPDMRRMFSPHDLESVLGYEAGTKDKPIRALARLEQMHQAGEWPDVFAEHVRFAWGVWEQPGDVQADPAV